MPFSNMLNNLLCHIEKNGLQSKFWVTLNSGDISVVSIVMEVISSWSVHFWCWNLKKQQFPPPFIFRDAVRTNVRIQIASRFFCLCENGCVCMCLEHGFSSAQPWCTPPHLIHFPTSPHLSVSILSPLTDTVQFVCFSACIHLESCSAAHACDVTQNDAPLKRALSTSFNAIMLIRLLGGDWWNFPVPWASLLFLF